VIPEHLSYSALSRYEECPRSFYLGRVKNAEPKQTWFFPIGTAVHNMIEDYISTKDVENMDIADAEHYFYPLVEKQLKIDPDDVNWLAGGPLDDPIIRSKALDQVKACFEAAVTYLEDIDVWEVEYDATGNLPGCEVPIKAFIDIVGEHKKHGPVIVDWKTGKQKPKNNLQLETYVALIDENKLDLNWGTIPKVGLWAMLNPEAANARKVDLSQVDAAALGLRYQAAYDAIKEKKWQAKQSFNCRFCTMAPNCLIEAGPTVRAKYYDKSEEEGLPF